ncbi:hypothetical protein HYP99_gp065 [Sinorhizobium phage ort11]|uniref:Transmembrane protein n=1 Tax=Sinorhizobium phage ort11 TaxID=2599764 RepID=A0A5C2H6F5_9CAUD|nr:hypothetical protein HYP99_gp065 [Sinorhizobium phage ort11]QEP29863.1 hypothetical protein Smphiort11_065 [Sinorhizobium phage ort11]
MDLLLAILIGIIVVIVYFAIGALIIAMIPVLVGLGIFAMAAIIAYALLKSRH